MLAVVDLELIGLELMRALVYGIIGIVVIKSGVQWALEAHETKQERRDRKRALADPSAVRASEVAAKRARLGQQP